jgi:hypothetical protein
MRKFWHQSDEMREDVRIFVVLVPSGRRRMSLQNCRQSFAPNLSYVDDLRRGAESVQIRLPVGTPAIRRDQQRN